MGFLQDISKRYAIPENQLTQYLRSAPHRYKVYTIPKRSGRGVREIAQPAKALKWLQKAILKDYFVQKMPVHDCATAYVKKRNISFNAGLHANNSFLLKMDFSNFFPSIESHDFVSHSGEYFDEFTREHEFVTERLFFRKSRGDSRLLLSAGAPSSPFISNTLMYSFDESVCGFCISNGVTYSRYADDLAFSSMDCSKLKDIPEFLVATIKQLGQLNLVINESKTVLVSKRENRNLTGLVLTNDGSVSLGRERKRLIRSMIHKYSMGELTGSDVSRLRGLLSFASSVERTFYLAMRKKYGDRVPDGLFF